MFFLAKPLIHRCQAIFVFFVLPQVLVQSGLHCTEYLGRTTIVHWVPCVPRALGARMCENVRERGKTTLNRSMHICHVSKCLVLSPQHWDLWSGIDLRLSRWVTGRTWWDLDDEWRQVDAMMPKDFEVQLCSTLHHYLIKCLRCV